MQITNNINALNRAASKPTDTLTTANENADKAQQLQQKNTSEQASQTTRFDVDQQAILLFEKQQGNTAAQQSANKQQNTLYDQPSNKNQTAVAAYETVNNIADRSNIQQSFGVDMLA